MEWGQRVYVSIHNIADNKKLLNNMNLTKVFGGNP